MSSLAEVRKRIRRPLGNVRPLANDIRSAGSGKVAESHESIQNQLDELQTATYAVVSSLIEPTGDVANPGVTINGVPFTY